MTPERLIFCHVFKAGGTSFAESIRLGIERSKGSCESHHVNNQPDFERVVSRYPDADLVHGHFVYDKRATGRRWITMLRHPMERIASQYSYLRYGETGIAQAQQVRAGQVPFQEFLLDPAEQPLVQASTYHLASLHKGWVFPGWLQQEAIRVLREEMFFVGLTEHYEESCARLSKLLGYEVPPCTLNVTPPQHRYAMTPESIALAEKALQGEMMIYEAAVRLWREGK